MTRLTNTFNPTKVKNVYAYIDDKKRKIGYAYYTQNGSLCVKGDKMLDKNQLGRLVIKGLYIDKL